MLRRELSPESQQRLYGLLAAGHFVTPAESYSLVTTTAPPTAIQVYLGVVLTASSIAILIAAAVIMFAACWWRNRKISVLVDVSIQVDITDMPNFVFTQYGNCYHYRSCETVLRRSTTMMLRRPCLVCIPQGVDVEPEAEQG